MTKCWIWTIVGALLVLPAACADPDGATSSEGMAERGMQAWQDETVADLEQMRDKFLSLGEAFPEDTWDWQPMEGTRSIRDVMVLMVAEGNIFPSMWGATPPSSTADGMRDEIARVTAMDKAGVMREMQSPLNYMVEAARSMTPPDRAAPAEWFGTPTTATGVVTHAIIDMHEHLGQSIAHARTNQIVPAALEHVVRLKGWGGPLGCSQGARTIPMIWRSGWCPGSNNSRTRLVWRLL